MKRKWASFILLPAIVIGLRAQQPEPLITTIAGTDFVFPGKVAAMQAPFANIADLAVGPDGNLYLCDNVLSLVLKLTGDGTVSVAAGNGLVGVSGENGPATSAMIDGPHSLAFDRSGNFYTAGGVVRKIDTQGIIRTVAGGAYNFTADGVPANNTGVDPAQIALDASGNLYIADSANNRIRMVDTAGIIHTIGGNGKAENAVNGSIATQSGINDPRLVAVDSKGNVYFEEDNRAVRRIRKDNGVIERFAGMDSYGADPFNGADARTVNIGADRFAVDRDDSLIFATRGYLLRVDQNYKVTVIGTFNGDMTANNPGTAPAQSGSASKVNFDFETLAIDPAGNIFVGSYDQRVRKIDLATATFQLIAGTGKGHFSGDGGPSASASLFGPGSVDIDSQGNIYIADTGNYRLRQIDTAGIIHTVAGNGGAFGDSRTDVPAVQTTVYPTTVRVDSLDRPTILRYYDQILRLQGGMLSNLLDPAVGYDPSGIAIGAGDSVFMAGNIDSMNVYSNQISRLGADGKPVVVAGTGIAGFSGESSSALSTLLNFPTKMVFDTAGNLLFIDAGNMRIRRLSPAGIVNTIAGGGMTPPGEGVPALQAFLADLDENSALTADRFGNTYFTYDNGIYRFATDGILHVVVSWSYGEFAGDGGPARLAALYNPADLATDKAGNLYIADSGNNRIRVVLKNLPNISVDRTSLSFSAAYTGAPTSPGKVEIVADISGVDFTIDLDGAWLSVTPNAGASPRILEVRADPSQVPGPGEFDGRVIIHALNAAEHQIVVPVHFSVSAALPPLLGVDKDLLSYTYSVNGSPRSQLLTISNSGGGSLGIMIQSTTQQWLRVDTTTGTLKAATPIQVLVTADPTGLAAGTYRGQVVVTGSDGSSVATAVVMTITSNPKAILLSQTGLSFLGVAGGGIVPPQDFSVLSLGTSAVSFTITPITLAGNSTWLRAVADAYSSNSASDPPAVHVSVDQSGLAAGSYYGQIRVDAQGAANSPQTVTVVLRVLPGDAPPPPAVVQPAELTFKPTSNDPPSSQSLTIYNLGVSPLSFRLSRPFSIYALPYDATVNPQQPFPVVVQPSYGYGLDSGALSLAFSDGTVSEVPFTIINVGLTPSSRSSTYRPRADGGCTPSSLNLTVRYIGQTGFLQAGWPAGMGLEVRDDCSNPLTRGAVTAKFSNGDSAVSLTHVGNGVWQGTWASSQSSSHVEIDFHAEDATGLVAADRAYQTDLTSGDMPPSVAARNVVSYNSPSPNSPLAPGTLITFTGTNLTSGDTYAPASPPLRVKFNGLSVVLKDELLPLLYASPTRVDAMIPFDIDPNVPQQLQIQLNNTQSTPIYLNLAPAAPVILAGSDSHAAALNIRADGQTANTPASPAQAGDTVIFYCIGLGAVDQFVDAGSGTPASPLVRTTNAVTLQIGGQNVATTDPNNLAMLTPGYVGLYQLAVVIPPGTQTGDAVPVTVTVAGQMSQVAYLSVQAGN